MDALLELLEPQRTIVDRAGEPEAELDQRRLPGDVALVHPVELRHGDVRLVQDDEVVVGEVVEQRVGSAAGLAAVEVPRVVLDPEQKPTSRSISRS